MANNDQETVVIKKYANRRLYNTQTSVYVTLDDLYQMVRVNQDFVVQDAKTGEDLTRQTLTQIILEQENREGHVLPTEFLRSVIHFYDDGMKDVFTHYLNASMQSFMANQEKMRNLASRAMQDFSPMARMSKFEEMTRQNVAMFERAFSMFNPFGAMFGGTQNTADEKKPEEKKR